MIRTIHITKNHWKLLVFIILLLPSEIDAQVYLQIEKFGNPSSIKFEPGDAITIKTKSVPDQWITKNILHILYEENVIVFDDDIMTPDFIIQVKIDKPEMKVLGTRIMQFGFVWFVFAGVLELTDRHEFGTDTAVIGGSALGLGLGIRTFLSKKVYKMGKNSRLRIVDLRFSVNPLHSR